MKFHPKASGAMTLVETMVASMLIGVFGLVIYSMLNMGTILGAKNLSVNVAHEQARTAMLQMIQDLHSAVSLPELISDVDVNGNPVPTSTSPNAGLSFQLWSIGPLRIAADAATNQKVVQVTVPAGTQAPVQPAAGQRLQRLIVRTHQLEDDITTVSPANIGTLGGTVSLTLANNVPVSINASTDHIVCFITDRCSYLVKNGALNYYGPRSGKAFAALGNNITNPVPFSTKLNNSGTPYAQFVAAFDLSTADANYSNLGSRTAFRSANILLQSEVPMRARLTNTQ